MSIPASSITAVPRRPTRWTWLFIVAVVFVPTLAYVLFVKASPPGSIVIAGGAKDGQYYQFARRYAEELKRKGIAVEVRETQGSAENLELLADPTGKVSVALVQGGMADAELHAELRALGSLYREPLWIFLRRDLDVSRLDQLAGKRIAVGKKGSGTRLVALQLLEACGVSSNQTTLHDAGGQAAADLLEQGAIDVAFLVASMRGETRSRRRASFLRPTMSICRSATRRSTITDTARRFCSACYRSGSRLSWIESNCWRCLWWCWRCRSFVRRLRCCAGERAARSIAGTRGCASSTI